MVITTSSIRDDADVSKMAERLGTDKVDLLRDMLIGTYDAGFRNGYDKGYDDGHEDGLRDVDFQ